MPHILVSSKPNYSPYCTGSSAFADLAQLLQKLAVKHLTADEPGGDLVEDDIDVTFSELGPYDRQKKDVVITITANHFPSRIENCRERLLALKRDAMASGAFHRDITVGFWLLLPQSAWEEV